MYESLISIIIPVYNVELYLEKCLNSVINQSYKNIEIILINDGSTDNSGKICDEFKEKDNRIKVLHKENEGQAIARNKGIDLSNGEYIMFIDSDDFIELNMVEILYNNLINSKSDIVCCARIIEKNQKSRLVNNKGTFFMDSKQGIERLIFQEQVDSSPCDKIYKKELFKTLRFPEGVVYEDLGLIYKLFDKADKIMHIEDALYHYNIHENSTMTTNIKKFNKKSLDELKIKEEMKEFISNKYPELKNKIEALYYMTLIDILIKCYESNYDEKIYKKLNDEVLKNSKIISKNKQINRLSKIKLFFIKNNKINLFF